MITVPLGKSALRIPRIALGGVPFGREITEEISWDILDHALAKGVNLIDTAEAYGGGNARQSRIEAYKVDDVREVSDEMHSSEKIIGRWMKHRHCRHRVVICTKFSTAGDAAAVAKSLRGSLERLQTDYIDIYMLHCPFPGVPIAETLEALTAEVAAGRIRTIGASNFSAAQLREAQETAARLKLARFESVQPAFSLAATGIMAEFLPYCREHRISPITYSPLGAGFLTGKYTATGAIPKGTRFDVIPGHINVYFSEQNFAVVEKLRALAEETGHSMAKLAMAWVLQHEGIASVLVGARKISQLDNALEALNDPISPELKARMDSWFVSAPAR